MWKLHPQDAIKINFDVVWTKDKTGLGFIVIDHVGRVIYFWIG